MDGMPWDISGLTVRGVFKRKRARTRFDEFPVSVIRAPLGEIEYQLPRDAGTVYFEVSDGSTIWTTGIGHIF